MSFPFDIFVFLNHITFQNFVINNVNFLRVSNLKRTMFIEGFVKSGFRDVRHL